MEWVKYNFYDYQEMNIGGFSVHDLFAWQIKITSVYWYTYFV